MNPKEQRSHIEFLNEQNNKKLYVIKSSIAELTTKNVTNLKLRTLINKINYLILIREEAQDLEIEYKLKMETL